MSIQELFQPNSYDIFCDTITANNLVIPSITPSLTVGPPGPFNVLGTSNLSGPVNAIDTTIPNPFLFQSSQLPGANQGTVTIDNTNSGTALGAVLRLALSNSASLSGGTPFIEAYNSFLPNIVFSVDSDGTVVCNGANIYNQLFLSNQGPPGTPFVNGLLGYLAGMDVLTALNTLQQQPIPPACVSEVTGMPYLLNPADAWTSVPVTIATNRSTFTGGSFAASGGGIQVTQAAPFSNLIDLSASITLDAPIPAISHIGLRIFNVTSGFIVAETYSIGYDSTSASPSPIPVITVSFSNYVAAVGDVFIIQALTDINPINVTDSSFTIKCNGAI